ncbi:MAG: aspartate--tRNA(Asn) ligase [Nitrososphaerota archaeon]|jgi:asparaginyl-tRNA synthetase|nr:aspartate--tRNA(Asn) ligase [Nitrososphaerota archaeon]MDG6959673.1 aspartate--tRNA(Asn) ligase [Nitrososphaerota archaeon]MDG6968947.1 aspartate--tRNA(Asn) ligase [Nitrososphaerota archaeon]MDG6973284.1 aspartate--tRNA(Asn) ligase [Nitrososphaerota archaeon]MDG6976809.1 aspartate--tRNA(Asn) ligase [Nitrososphaerota archaeon]
MGRASTVDAFAPSSASEILAGRSPKAVEIRGWVARKHTIGGLVFVQVRDGTGYVQVSARKGTSDAAYDSAKGASKESAVVVRGEVRDDRRAPGGKEVAASGFVVVAAAESWPITRTAAKSPSFLFDKRHLSIRGPKAIAAMRIRAEVIGATFDYFRENGFQLISAPTFVQAAVEGGSTLFTVDYFGKKVSLSQSAQFYEEAALPALQKVWIFQPAFRAEKSKTAKHLTEFWMIEAEQAFAEQPDNMKVQEGLLSKMVERVLANREADLKTLGRTLRQPEVPFPRMSYDEARSIAESKGFGFEWGDDLPTEAERAVSLTQESPFFITDYPLTARSFYHMTYADRPKVTKSADLIAPEGVGELATGGQRIHDYHELMARISSQDLPAESFSWYLELRKFGMPPHSGFGIGVERTTRWIAGLKHIRSASLFPRTLSRISP